MTATVLRGDARHLPLPDASVDLIVTSPPYFGLRSYTDGGEHYPGQIGSESTPGEYVATLVECTREWVRVLKPEGSLFVNLGDRYAGGGMGGHKGGSIVASSQTYHDGQYQPQRGIGAAKSLLGLPWRYALTACDQLGLILRRDIIWSKPNGLPESVTDRCRSSHEYVFHLVRQPRYYSAVDEIREPQVRTMRGALSGAAPRVRDMGSKAIDSNPLGTLPGSVWTIPSQPLTVPPWLGVDHFAAFPMELPRRIIAGWSPAGVCTGCGQGRRPVTLHHGYTVEGGRNNGTDAATTRHGTAGATLGLVGRRSITGYTCDCRTSFGGDVAAYMAPTHPAVVLDPFGGTGTAALVASALGRHGISVDMSADYTRLARWRCNDPAERARALEVPKPPPVHDDQIPMFDLAR